MKYGKSERVYRNICLVVVTIFGLLCLYPLLYTVFVSLCSEKEWIARGGMLWFIPSKPTLAAYGKVLGSSGLILQSLLISILRTLVGTVLGMIVTALTAFALSRKDLPGKKPYMYLILFTILFNGGLIPGYLTIQALGLRNTFWVMVIPLLLSTWNVLIFKQFFEGIPRELEEAAQVDGVNTFQMFFNIIIPMSKPVLAAIGLFTMVGHWNSWFDASIYIDATHKYLWPIQLFTRVSFDNMTNISQGGLDFIIAGGASVNSLSMRMALTIITMIPILAVYPFFQKYFMQGVYLGAVKG